MDQRIDSSDTARKRKLWVIEFTRKSYLGNLTSYSTNRHTLKISSIEISKLCAMERRK